MSSRPRILFFSNRFLFPLDTGGRIRTAKTLEALRGHWEVTLVGGYDPARDDPRESSVAALAEDWIPVAVSPLPRPRGLKLAGRRLKRLFSTLPLAVRYETHPLMSRVLARTLAARRFDLFVCDFLQPTANVPWPVPAATLLFTHNVESRITARQAAFAPDLRTRVLWTWQNALMSRYEGRTARRFDRVVAVSESDRQEFETRFGLANVRAIPTGVDTQAFAPQPQPADRDHVVFCGSMDWSPNQDAARWFMAEIWPRIRRERPRARFTLVGRDPPPKLAALASAAPGVELTGWVADVRPWLARAACVVVPLRIGGGTRIKIYEALAMARPVVSTRVGAEGLPLEPGRHFYAADDPGAFAAAVIACLAGPEAAGRVGSEGREFVATRFGWKAVAEAFARIGQEAIDGRTAP